MELPGKHLDSDTSSFDLMAGTVAFMLLSKEVLEEKYISN